MPKRGDFNHLTEVVRTLANEDDRMAENLAEYIAGRAQIYAPFRTGRLSSRIRVSSTGNGKRAVISDTSGPGIREYAAYNEYGTRYMEAQPYMRPAATDGIRHAPVVGAQMGRRVEASARTGRVV
jgi:HK97 gp10 family phage protein